MGRASTAKRIRRSDNPASPYAPGDTTYQREAMRWIGLAIQEGLAQNRAEYHWDKIGQIIDAIMGVDEPQIRSPRLSNARFNKIQKIALELRALLTDIKPFWTYTTNSDRYQKQADIFGKLSKSWFMRRGIDGVFRDAIDYCLAAGSAYIHLFFNPDTPGPLQREDMTFFEGDIDAVAEDPRDVGMIRWAGGDKRTVQNSRGCFVRRERPTSWFLDFYGPDAARGIEVDRYGFEKESPTQRRVQEAEDSVLGDRNSAMGNLFGGAPAQRIGGPVPVTDEFTIYLHDFALNDSASDKEMGPWIDDPESPSERIPASPWSYIARAGARLYPFGRRIVATRQKIIEDGPAHFHHGMLPLGKVTLDTWAWSRLGTSPLQPLLSLQRALDENVRAIQDHIRRTAKRNFIYDKKAVSPTLARKFDTRKSGMMLGINPHAAGPKGAFQIVEEPPLDGTVLEWHKLLLDSMDELSGVANLRKLAGLQQVPSADTIEQLVQSMTPLVRARSRSLEIFVREFAMMLASMFMQFYPVELRLRLLGQDGMTYEDWDYNPGDLMPDFISDDDWESAEQETNEFDIVRTGILDGMGNETTRFIPRKQVVHHIKPSAWKRGPAPAHIRNREFLRYFEFDVAPGTLLDSATISRRLLYLQLSRMGLVDHWTLGEVLQIPNQGKPPSWATDITKRLQAERIMGLGILASTAGRAPTAQAMPSMTSTGAIAESR